MDSADESQLLAKQILRGEKQAFDSFYRNTRGRLSRYVIARVKNETDAEEVVQDAFLSFLDALPTFGGRSSLWTFLVAIARHEIADYYRKLYAKKAIKYVPFWDHIYTEPVYETDEAVEGFYAAMSKLKTSERALLVWKYEQKMSVKEIAVKLGLGVKAVESRLFRARQAFVLAYEKEGGATG